MYLLFAVDAKNNAQLQGAYPDQDAAQKEADRIHASWQTNQANAGSRLVVAELNDLYTVPSPDETEKKT